MKKQKNKKKLHNSIQKQGEILRWWSTGSYFKMKKQKNKNA